MKSMGSPRHVTSKPTNHENHSYELEGDTVKFCFGAPEGERPADFTSKRGDRRALSVWKREKAAVPQPKPK
jgi:hypothetical protein